jgi:thermitase
MMPDLEAALAEPSFDALTIEVDPQAAGEPATIAAEALAAAIAGVATAPQASEWRVVPVHPSTPRSFDMLPPADHEIGVKEGFDLKYALEQQSGVDYAAVLFDTNLDNLPEEPEAALPEDAFASSSIGWFDELSSVEQDPEWSLKMIEAQAAWTLSPDGQSQGQGVLVGHPDSGYIAHSELDDDRIRHDLERDIYGKDDVAENPQDRGGNHGLSTGSVIMSGERKRSPEQYVIGVAPKAEIVPLRITEKGAPVFFSRSGPRTVRDAVHYAIDSGCHVISMSMGGPGERTLHKALKRAVAANILVVAAAGNIVRLVIWPARYPETVAVAACTARRERWFHSSRGKKVDVTAPGHNVWRAFIQPDGTPGARPSSGTSYATAVTAGLAALWLSHHGRDQLLSRYDGISLNDVFRQVLKDSCDEPPSGHNGNFGRGIVNARRLLEAPLPPASDLRAEPGLDGVAFGAVEQPAGGEEGFFATLDSLPEPDVRRNLSAMMGKPESELDDDLAGLEDELLFHILTNPQLRSRFVATDEMSEGAEDDAFAFGAPAGSDVAVLKDTFQAVPGLSDSVKGRIAPSPPTP